MMVRLRLHLIEMFPSPSVNIANGTEPDKSLLDFGFEADPVDSPLDFGFEEAAELVQSPLDFGFEAEPILGLEEDLMHSPLDLGFSTDPVDSPLDFGFGLEPEHVHSPVHSVHGLPTDPEGKRIVNRFGPH
jgi:hypothetical protein